jgi:dissimilatory sulfite reductase (desulfoviridin) alpha/beta subunit
MLGVYHHHKTSYPNFLTHFCCTQACEHVKTTQLTQDTSTCIQQATWQSLHCDDVSYYGQSELTTVYVGGYTVAEHIASIINKLPHSAQNTHVWQGSLTQITVYSINPYPANVEYRVSS